MSIILSFSGVFRTQVLERGAWVGEQPKVEGVKFIRAPPPKMGDYREVWQRAEDPLSQVTTKKTRDEISAEGCFSRNLSYLSQSSNPNWN